MLDGQQKLEGNPGLLHTVKVVVLDVGHVLASLSKRSIICVACTAAESAVDDGTVEEMRQTAVSLRNVKRPMAICRMVKLGNDDRKVARLCSGNVETAQGQREAEHKEKVSRSKEIKRRTMQVQLSIY